MVVKSVVFFMKTLSKSVMKYILNKPTSLSLLVLCGVSGHVGDVYYCLFDYYFWCCLELIKYHQLRQGIGLNLTQDRLDIRHQGFSIRRGDVDHMQQKVCVSGFL